jgi:glycosyltransferase involved in cell wall biosynthesis
LLLFKSSKEVQSKPLVSVIMSVFNGEPKLQKSITSILSQTYVNLEFLIVDDGSADGSKKIIESYALLDPRIKPVFFDNNQGLTLRLAELCTLARGKYIARQDADDFSFPTRIAEQVILMESRCDVSVCGSRGLILRRDSTKPIISPRFNPALVKFELLFNNIFIHSSLMFRSKDLIEIVCYGELIFPLDTLSIKNFSPIGPSQDYLLLCGLSFHKNIVLLNKVLVCKDDSSENSISNSLALIQDCRRDCISNACLAHVLGNYSDAENFGNQVRARKYIGKKISTRSIEHLEICKQWITKSFKHRRSDVKELSFYTNLLKGNINLGEIIFMLLLLRFKKHYCRLIWLTLSEKFREFVR